MEQSTQNNTKAQVTESLKPDPNNKPPFSIKAVILTVTTIALILCVSWYLLFISPLGMLAVLLFIPLFYFGLPAGIIAILVFVIYRLYRHHKNQQTVIIPKINGNLKSNVVTDQTSAVLPSLPIQQQRWYGRHKILLIFLIIVLIVLLIPIDRYTRWDKIHAGGRYYYGILGVYAKNCHGGGFFGCSTVYDRMSGDIFHFKYIGSDSLATDSKHVYCNGKLVDLSKNSLQVLDDSIFKEKIDYDRIELGIFKNDKQVYSRYCSPLTFINANKEYDFHDLDAPSFTLTPFMYSVTHTDGIVYHGIVQDKNGIYYFTSRYQSFVRLDTEPGPLSIKQLGKDYFEIKGKSRTYIVTKTPYSELLDIAVK